MSKRQVPGTTTKTYEIKVTLEECSHDNVRRVIWEETLGVFPSEKEALDIFGLVELPDMDHITVI